MEIDLLDVLNKSKAGNYKRDMLKIKPIFQGAIVKARTAIQASDNFENRGQTVMSLAIGTLNGEQLT